MMLLWLIEAGGRGFLVGHALYMLSWQTSVKAFSRGFPKAWAEQG